MLSYKENFSTASENYNYVCIGESQCLLSHIFFYSKNLVETSGWRKLINENDLSAVLNHAMTRKACEGEDDL